MNNPYLDTKVIALSPVLLIAYVKGAFKRFPERFPIGYCSKDISGRVDLCIQEMDKISLPFKMQNTALQFVNEVNEDQKVWERLFKSSYDEIALQITNGRSFSEIINLTV